MSKDQPIAVKDAVYKLQLAMLEGIKDQKQLFAAGSLMSRSDYEDVVTERTIANLCGYPLCTNSLPSAPSRTGRYRISLKEHKVYDLQETSKFCSSGCLVSSRAFSGTLQEERCSVLNPAKLNETLSLFQDLSLEDSLEVSGDLGLSRLKIHENEEPKGGEVSLEEWMGPSNAIEGYVPKNVSKAKASLSKNSEQGSSASQNKPTSKKDCMFNEMDFMSTVITSDEYSVSKMSQLYNIDSPLNVKSEKSDRKGGPKDSEQQAVVSGPSSIPRKKASKKKLKESKGKVKIVEKEKIITKEIPQTPFQDDTTTGASKACQDSHVENACSSSDAAHTLLKSSGAKKLGRSVTWADEKAANGVSGNLCEVREIEDTTTGCEPFPDTIKDDGEDALRIASAEACARALSQAVEAVASGDLDVSAAVFEAGVVLLPNQHQVTEESRKEGEEEMLESEPTLLKWPRKLGTPDSDIFDPDESWFDETPEGFSLSLSTFATIWNSLFGWVTSSSLAYIYGKDETFHEDYLFINGREYPRKITLEDGRSSEIKETLAGCLARALPGLIADLRLPIPVSELEKGLACLLDTMSFMEALPAFRTKEWQAILLLFIDALSVNRIPSIASYMTSGRMLLQKVLDGAGISVEEYETLKDLLIPLGRVPLFCSQSGA